MIGATQASVDQNILVLRPDGPAARGTLIYEILSRQVISSPCGLEPHMPDATASQLAADAFRDTHTACRVTYFPGSPGLGRVCSRNLGVLVFTACRDVVTPS